MTVIRRQKKNKVINQRRKIREQAKQDLEDITKLIDLDLTKKIDIVISMTSIGDQDHFKS